MNQNQPAEVTISRYVEWGDTESAGRAHVTAIPRLVEAAERALLSELGIPPSIHKNLPRRYMSLDLDIAEPLRFNDLATIHLRVAKVGWTSITYAFTIRRRDVVSVRGEVTTVHVEDPGEPSPLQEQHRELLLTAGHQKYEDSQAGDDNNSQ